MNLFELFKSTKNIIMEGIDHPEDLIISQGSAGADKVLKDLASLEKDPSTVTVKWDGFPAVVFGRNKAGELVFMDKHMYTKVADGKMDFTTIKAYDEGRGANRSSLWEAESILRPTLEKIVPAGKDQFWMGDLMWTGTPPTNNGQYVFKPNTVEYRVSIDGELGNRIGRSVGGIAVHTFIPGLGASDQPLVGLKGLPEDGGITFLVGEMKDKPAVIVDPKVYSEAKATIDNNRQAVDKFINELTAMKGKSVITAMGPFITRMLEENDIKGDIVPRFMEFLKERLTPAAASKMLGTNNDGWLFQESGGAPGLRGVWMMWAAITELKIHIKQQIDTHQQGSEVQAITDGLNAHEGYVFGAGKDKLKLVDRLGFTRAHFGKFNVPDEEIAEKSKMPLAVFCFGRMNPPTKGHGLVINKTLEEGGDNAFIFLSNSVGPEDPLDPTAKAAFIEQIYPQAKGHIVTDYVQGPIYAANWLYAKGYRNMAFVAGSDRLGKEKGSIEKLLNSWNSGPVRTTDPAGSRDHVVMSYISSGERDPESTGVSGFSGTKARQAASAGDEAKFQQFTGVGPDVVVNGKTLYQATRDGMGIKDKPTAQPAPVSKPAPVAPSQQLIGKEPAQKKVPGKAPMKTKQPSLVESVLKDKEDYYAKRKALQDIQLDPHTHKDPELVKELIRAKHELEREAKKKGIISEAIIRTLVDEENFGVKSKRPVRDGSRPERGHKPQKRYVTDYCDACDRPKKDCICDSTNEDNDPCWKNYKQLGMKNKNGKQVPNCVPKNEARANTKAVRTGLSKREKRADPTMDAKKKSEQDAAWERLQAHMSKPENMAVMKRLAVKESPIEMDPQNPNDPMVMPPGLNPGKLSYRKSRAAAQLADLARMAAQANEKNSAIMWDTIVKHFPELETNIRSIQHGMQELEKVRRQGGVKSRGIDKV